MKWDPAAYETFACDRLRPFLDLMARVPRPAPGAKIVDAGCGTGRTTALLAHWFPDCDVLGVDSSPDMLAQVPDGIRTEQADLAKWSTRADLVVCNAVLHWIPDPAAMLGRLASWAPGGTVAIQVPANHDAPSHVAVRDVADELGIDAQPGNHMLPLQEMAAAFPDHVDAWETTYLHQVGSPEAVLEWLRGTTLRPYVAAGAGTEFEKKLAKRLREAYTDVYPFKRRFVVARSASPPPNRT